MGNRDSIKPKMSGAEYIEIKSLMPEVKKHAVLRTASYKYMQEINEPNRVLSVEPVCLEQNRLTANPQRKLPSKKRVTFCDQPTVVVFDGGNSNRFSKQDKTNSVTKSGVDTKGKTV